MTTLDQIAIRIIKEQELIIGPVAWSQAAKVNGLHITDQKIGTVTVDDNSPAVIDRLVHQYEHLFGKASIEVCKEATSDMLSTLQAGEIPQSLR